MRVMIADYVDLHEETSSCVRVSKDTRIVHIYIYLHVHTSRSGYDEMHLDLLHSITVSEIVILALIFVDVADFWWRFH